MKTVRGVYEDGNIKLLEPMPATGIKNILITFIDENEKEDETEVRGTTLQVATKQLKDYLKDEREDLYQDYLK